MDLQVALCGDQCVAPHPVWDGGVGGGFSCPRFPAGEVHAGNPLSAEECLRWSWVGELSSYRLQGSSARLSREGVFREPSFRVRPFRINRATLNGAAEPAVTVWTGEGSRAMARLHNDGTQGAN